MRHVATHLMRAGREPQLRMMLFDAPWVEAKLKRCGLYVLLADFRMYLEVQEDTEVKLLMQALEMSAPVAAEHPEVAGLLSAHVACRLRSQTNAHGSLARYVQMLAERWAEQAQQAAMGQPGGVPALWPGGSGLRQAGGSLLKTLTSAICAPTKSLSITPDGAMLLTVEGRVSRLWDVASGFCMRVLEGYKDSLMTGALSPNGAIAVTIADFRSTDIGRVWDCTTGRCRHVLEGHTDLIQDLQISQNSLRCITASYDTTARVWDLVSGKCLQTLVGHVDYVEAAAFSPDGGRAVTASWDKTARIWSVETGRCLHVLEGHTDRVWRLAVGSSYVVTTSWDTTACVWELGSGDGLWRLEGHEDLVHAVAISANEKTVVTASQDGSTRVWDIEIGQCKQVLTGQNSSGKISVSPDGTRLVSVSGSSDLVAQVWDLGKGTCIQTLEGHGDKITGIAMTADGRRAVTASWDRTARLWDLSSRDKQEYGHRGPVRTVCTREGSNVVASCATDGTGLVWGLRGSNQPSFQPLRPLAPSATALALVSGGLAGLQPLAVGIGADACLRLWDTSTGECLHESQLDCDSASTAALTPTPFGQQGPGAPAGAPLLAAGETALATCAPGSGTVELWAVTRARSNARAGIVAQLEHEDTVEGLVLSRDGEVAATLAGGRVRVWEAMAGDLNGVLSTDEASEEVASIAISGDGEWIITATKGNVAIVWGATSQQRHHELILSRQKLASTALLGSATFSGATVSVVIAESRLSAATASSSGIVEVWDVASGSLAVQLPHPAPVATLALTPNADYVAAACNDCTIMLWDARNAYLCGKFVGDTPMLCCSVRVLKRSGHQDKVAVEAGDVGGQLHTLSSR
mmetsp:Transcript_27828/g.78692  ORF Transcript_27828/g.78692 Transcript_27828/m.78692 type:complete len:862 (-) Transcript_27828:303-2888(-)